MANEEKAPETEATEQAQQAEQAVAEEVTAEEQAALETDPLAEEAEPELQSVAELMSQLEVAQAEAAALKDQMLRGQAEIQNIRRRAEQDVEKAHKFGVEKFATEMLAIADNLERAIEAAGDDEAVKPMREGVEMTLNMFVSGLAKFNVEQVNPEGEPFNPELHQAMSMVPAEGVEANTVVAVMQKGYTLNGRLVRPAMVMVAKG
ncbi:nucleotide exchange factor GrpE [Pontibacterium granulatum]|uniref:nucleotide exchange factor GrpE n=1 Tax=Pontibacterium granulatum TaxID=2036029 RepID=UPI00249C9E72|nr:nucleotide exchange factor GrpE [Pontibacterium granulatum]MDI3323086.1 nucleotide exchange factor GrpE [Pontibacterium granulatum]